MHNLDCFAAFLNKKKKKKSPNFPFIDYVCKKKKILMFLPISRYAKSTINILSEQVLYRIHFQKKLKKRPKLSSIFSHLLITRLRIFMNVTKKKWRLNRDLFYPTNIKIL